MAMKKVIYRVSGMSCPHCEAAVSAALRASCGVSDCTVSAQNGEASCTFDETVTNVEALKNQIIKAGYHVL